MIRAREPLVCLYRDHNWRMVNSPTVNPGMEAATSITVPIRHWLDMNATIRGEAFITGFVLK